MAPTRPTHPAPPTPAHEPNWRVAGPLLGPDAKQKLMGILTCAAVRERIQRRIAEFESNAAPPTKAVDGAAPAKASKRWPSGDDGEWR